jgi:hypothetical protein
MTELFYWKEIERRARAAQALAMLHNGEADGVSHGNAILDELCLDRKGAERLIRSRMPPRPSRSVLSSSRATRPPFGGVRPALQSLIRSGRRWPAKHAQRRALCRGGLEGRIS